MALFAVLLVFFCMNLPKKVGDFPEYGIMTIAFASHGTPDIRLSDIQTAKRLNPEPFFNAFYQGLEDGIRRNAVSPAIAFQRGRDSGYYAIHFFAYSAIAAIPFAIFDAVGIPPFKCYQFVNLACIYLLGLACLGFFGSGRSAAAATGLFVLCGGALYWDWSSPEVMTSAALLAALLLYLDNASIMAGMLAGIASMQNPPLVLFAGFAPVFKFFYQRSHGAPSASIKDIASLAIVILLFLLPVVFNLSKFGVPNLLAAATTEPRLISATRLFSFFFDLSQGMVIGIPALFVSLVWILAYAKRAALRLLACAALLFSVAMAIPALSTQNWNSGAAGMMRYAFWAAMPILFACLVLARDQTLPKAWILALLVLQAGATWMEQQYRHIEFSPLARFVLAHHPSAYNPAFEVFSERLLHREGVVSKDEVLYFKVDKQPTKIAFNLANSKQASLKICGNNRELSLDAGVSVVDDGWAYLNTPPVCIPALTETISFTLRDFEQSSSIRLGRGWGRLESGGANWDGSWTVAPVAQLGITPPSNVPYQTLTFQGQYIAAGMETDVFVNGVYLGRHALNRGVPIAVKSALRKNDGATLVELRTVPGKALAPVAGDTRQLGFFITRVTLQ
jgi:hypothetical protein